VGVGGGGGAEDMILMSAQLWKMLPSAHDAFPLYAPGTSLTPVLCHSHSKVHLSCGQSRSGISRVKCEVPGLEQHPPLPALVQVPSVPPLFVTTLTGCL